MGTSISSIPNAFDVGHRFVRPNWTVITDWVTARVAADQLNDTWTTLARDWLDQLRRSLPNEYAITESDEFLLLTKSDSRVSNRLLESCEHARRTILETLGEVARDQGYGKHVVIGFADTESYYDYITDFYPEEGEFALSGGMFLDVGYGHFVMCLAYGDQYERTIAHELNHALLRHLPLPLWLNEGVTQVMEDMVIGYSNFSVDLSQVLFRNLMSDFPRQISKFLNAANYGDAGDAALRQLCRTSLGDRVKQFLGDGDWQARNLYQEPDRHIP